MDESLQLTVLIHQPDFLGSANVSSTDEDSRKSKILLTDRILQLVEETRVHGEIALVDRDAEASENGSNGAAVLESAADDAKGGVVEDDPVVGVRDEAVGPGAKEGGGETDAVENGGLLGSVGRGIVNRIFATEVLNVFEGRTGEVAMIWLGRRLDSGRRTQPLRPHGEKHGVTQGEKKGQY